MGTTQGHNTKYWSHTWRENQQIHWNSSRQRLNERLFFHCVHSQSQSDFFLKIEVIYDSKSISNDTHLTSTSPSFNVSLYDIFTLFCFALLFSLKIPGTKKRAEGPLNIVIVPKDPSTLTNKWTLNRLNSNLDCFFLYKAHPLIK
jgi:hypothetical protein